MGGRNCLIPLIWSPKPVFLPMPLISGKQILKYRLLNLFICPDLFFPVKNFICYPNQKHLLTWTFNILHLLNFLPVWETVNVIKHRNLNCLLVNHRSYITSGMRCHLHLWLNSPCESGAQIDTVISLDGKSMFDTVVWLKNHTPSSKRADLRLKYFEYYIFSLDY